MKKYALHPGYVVSAQDEDVHRITGEHLARLYELKPGEYIIWEHLAGYKWDDYIHLYPNYEGRYGRPDVAQ